MIKRIRLYRARRRLKRVRAGRRKSSPPPTTNDRLAYLWRLASPSSGLVAGGVAIVVWVSHLERNWSESLSTGASVAFLTVLAVEVMIMVLSEGRFTREREARRAAEAQADLANLLKAYAEASAKQAEEARRNNDRLFAVILELLRDKGIDPDVIESLRKGENS